MSPFPGILDRILYVLQEFMDWNFPDGPVVKNPPSNAEDVGLIPGWGATRTPHATCCQGNSPCATTRTQHSQM